MYMIFRDVCATMELFVCVCLLFFGLWVPAWTYHAGEVLPIWIISCQRPAFAAQNDEIDVISRWMLLAGWLSGSYPWDNVFLRYGVSPQEFRLDRLLIIIAHCTPARRRLIWFMFYQCAWVAVTQSIFQEKTSQTDSTSLDWSCIMTYWAALSICSWTKVACSSIVITRTKPNPSRQTE